MRERAREREREGGERKRAREGEREQPPWSAAAARARGSGPDLRAWSSWSDRMSANMAACRAGGARYSGLASYALARAEPAPYGAALLLWSSADVHEPPVFIT